MTINNKFYLLNLGCAKNLVEGEHLAGILLSQGFQACAQPEDADWLLVNTCGFLTSAIEENIDHILELAGQKTERQKLAVVGCLVGRFGKKLQTSLPEVDLFVSPGQAANIAKLMQQPPQSGLAMAPAKTVMGFTTPRAVTTGPGWAYLRLSDGCSRNCSFCAIPHIRGKLRSRTMEDIINEAHALAEQGVKEISLVAQDVSAYGQDLGMNDGLLRLLQSLQNIEQLRWIRMLYLYPDVLQVKFIEQLGALNKVLPYFDIPLQHVSSRVLTAMGRPHQHESENLYLLRQVLPNAVVRSTLLVGHPGEEEEDFNQLIDFVKEYKFSHLGCFAFEPQGGTRSARMPSVAPHVARQRQKKVMAAQKKISKAKGRAMVGTEHEMLFLGAHPESELLGLGRLWQQAPEADGEVIVIDGHAEPGQIVKARITKAHDYDYEAEII